MRTTKRRKEWFDNDAFWRDTYPFMFPDSRFLSADEEVEKALTLCEPNGKRALDLCCGPGRCSIALAKRGFDVTGVDRTRFLLDKARSKARSVRIKVRWVKQDMRDFASEDNFDLILNMFSSFGYFENPDEDLIVLRNMFSSLRPGGSCLLELMGKERLAKIFLATSSDVLQDGSMLVQRRGIFDDWNRIRNEWILIRGSRAKRFKFHLNIYSGRELRDRMESVGFREVKLYGNLNGDPYGPDATRLVAAGRRPTL